MLAHVKLTIPSATHFHMMNRHRSLIVLPLFLLAAFCCLSAPSSLAAGVGAITHLSGDASILSADGKSRIAGMDATLNAGDTVTTGKKGQVAIRFSDESVVQLRPQSAFRVDEYAYKGKNDSEATGFFSLLKGSLRTITGMIGKLNRPGYGMRTSAATIGIRGTEYSAMLKNGLHVSVEKGEISLTNRTGSFAVTEGQRAFVRNQDSAPQYLQSGDASQGGGTQNGAAGNVQIHGDTRIKANTSNTTAVATGQGNRAANKAGVIGGE